MRWEVTALPPWYHPLKRMETQLFQELLKQGPLLLFLGVGLYVFYKKDEERRRLDLAERTKLQDKYDEQEKRFEDYLEKDKSIMQELIKDTKIVIEQQTKMSSRQNELTTCLIREIQEFKQSEIFKNYKAT